MRFQKLIVILAVLATASTHAQEVVEVSKVETTTAQAQTQAAPQAQAPVVQPAAQVQVQIQTQPVQQPATVVEAQPLVESRAEQMRKARQNAELQTEQKIVEKLEEARLKEEQERAQRLFNNGATAGAAATATAPVATQVGGATQTQEAQSQQVEEVKPTQVTIEKVEIIQPAAPVAPVAAPVQETVAAPVVAESVTQVEEAKEEGPVFGKNWYAGALIAAPNYQTSNVKSHYAIGASVGSFASEKWALEGTFLYSNHSVDTFWDPQFLYRDLDQFDFGGAAKYYVMRGQIRPFVGGSMTYIYRKYTGRVKYGYAYAVNPNVSQEETHSVNVGLLSGVEFVISPKITLNAGFDYNWNLMSKNEFDYSAYGLNDGRTPLEEIDYWTLKFGARYTF